jgi:glycosyltransferase involved in cell wall biosynthesis
MRIWVVEATEPIPALDEGFRALRCGMLTPMLAAAGHEVVWWSSTFCHEKKAHRFLHPQSIELQSQLRLNLLHGPGYATNVSPQRWRHNQIIAREFRREAETALGKPDVLFTCLPLLELSEAAVAFGQRYKIPIIVDVRDLWPDLYLSMAPPALHAVARLALTFEYRRVHRICRGATSIVAVSQLYLNWALAHARRVRHEQDGVYPLGYPDLPQLDTNDQRVRHMREIFHLEDNAMVVVFVGTFGTSYDLETVVEAARRLSAAPTSGLIRIVLVGDGDKRAKLEAVGRGLPNLVFTGWLDQATARQLMCISNVGLVAYTAEALQSLPNKPFEYMAAGLPMISSLRGELASIVRDEQIGLIYEAGNSESLAERIRELAADPAACRAMGKRARRLFEQRYNDGIIYPALVRHIEQMAQLSL